MLPMNVRANTYILAVTTTSGSEALATADINTDRLIVYNAGNVDVFLTTGNSTVTAVIPTDNTPQAVTIVAPGVYLTLTKNSIDTHFAAITAAGTATIYVKTGAGE